MLQYTKEIKIEKGQMQKQQQLLREQVDRVLDEAKKIRKEKDNVTKTNDRFVYSQVH